MLEMLQDANDFVYETALRREREEGGLSGVEVFILLCGKNPWFLGNRLRPVECMKVPVLDQKDQQLMDVLFEKGVYWRNENGEGGGRFDSGYPINFWLHWFARQGVKARECRIQKIVTIFLTGYSYRK